MRKTKKPALSRFSCGGRRRIASGVLPLALRAELRSSKIVPDDFVEPNGGSHLLTSTMSFILLNSKNKKT
ncbi:MAG: hypothetical protein KJ888_01145, partial [Gammaproteobacteria bacterium]|nr:hypothetical protein [Gammaproteobacteria bacterium]